MNKRRLKKAKNKLGEHIAADYYGMEPDCARLTHSEMVIVNPPVPKEPKKNKYKLYEGEEPDPLTLFDRICNPRWEAEKFEYALMESLKEELGR